ncbi:MAG: carbohydrate ABC transporter substrate-binding protein [Chloroflexi bacterium]|nr:carbohydrate ABC transporter substrate-binding protein [Chloroflexota bacterium]
MYKRLALLSIFVLSMMLVSLAPAGVPQAEAQDPELTIVWFAWPPCEALAELVPQYEGANVTVDCVPLAQWHDIIFTDFVAEGGADLPILDSQWIGEAVGGNHLVNLTDWMEANMELDDYVPAALSAYGEYPAGSGVYYGVPAMADVQMLVYRADIFEEEGLDEPADTWYGLLEQAQELKDSDTIENGFTWFWCGSVGCVDQVQTAWNQIAWSFGGELWDPAEYQVEGVLNSDENVEALEFAAELYLTGPDGSGDFTYDEVLGSLCNGTSAMTSIWVGFGPVIADPNSCAEAENFAYAVPPGQTDHYLSLGGQGMSVSAYGDVDAALDFLAWFQMEETQLEWIRLGGYSARYSILESDEFVNAAPYNGVFADAYPLVKDFWNLPEYSELLEVQGEYLNLAIVGEMAAEEALSYIAEEQQYIIDDAYPDGPQ